MSDPAGLPDLIDTDGDWDLVVKRLYAVFERDFAKGKPTFEGLPIWWERRREADDPYEDGFRHLIERESDDKTIRLFDPPRAQRLAWCVAVIQNAADPAVLRWNYREGDGRVRTYLWLRNFDYVVILERKTKHNKRDGSWFDIYDLITAFHVDGDAKRLDLQQRYAARL
jgi:hypothetical protein